MNETESKFFALDAAYKPFPTFQEWLSKTTVDRVRWDRYIADLTGKSSATSEGLRRAREVVKRAAALDTGAIEGLYEVDRGFTYTVAFESAAWELELAKRGENVRPLFEAQMQAYDYVLDLATKAEPTSEAAIRTLHEVVCKAQTTYRVVTAIGPQEQELVKGRYKVLPNHVRTRDGADHSYAPVDVTPAEMQRLVEELRSAAFLGAHPVTQAAYAHYGLVVIHPFPDGNGRVARALASAFTYRAISMPIMILSEHKTAYLDALEAADRGEFQPFVDFMLARSLDTMALVSESLKGARAPSPAEGAAAIQGLFLTRGGYSQEQVDRAGAEFLEIVHAEVQKTISKVNGPNLHGISSKLKNLSGMPDSSHRWPVSEEKGLHVEFNSSAPAQAKVFQQYAVYLPRDAGGEDDIQLVLVGAGNQQHGVNISPEVRLVARVDEIIPAVSGVLQIRVGLFADREVGGLLAELKPLAEKSLHS